MLRWAGPLARKRSYDILCEMWNTPAEQWTELIGSKLLTGVVFLLWKQKGSVEDLDKYRGIVLLAIMSRWLARILATRLSVWAEKVGALEPSQWGFRPHRQCVDVIFVARTLAEEATSGQSGSTTDPLTLCAYDIKKAYPNCSRSVTDEVYKRLGLTEQTRQLMKGLHSTTQYVINTDTGRSKPYPLGRGFREGCPSSCTGYNLVHNVGLWLLTEGPDQIPGVVVQTRCDRPLPRNGRWNPDSEVPTFTIKTVGFADDTSTLQRKSKQVEVERQVLRTFQDLGEEVHPGKVERIVFDGGKTAPDGYVQHLRLLGGWLSQDGTSHHDTQMPIGAARTVWRKLHRQMPRLGLSLRIKGMVIRATVIASMLYNTEVRSHTYRDLDAMRKFINRVIRGAVWRPSRGGTRDMEGKLFQTDLRLSLGLDDVETMIIQRQLGYLGHLARYNDQRIEKLIFGCAVEESSTADRRLTTAKQYWKRIQSVMSKQTEIVEREWPTRWMEVARANNGKVWKDLCDKVVEENRLKHNADTWALRHSAEREAERAAVEIRGTNSQDRQALCTKCGSWISLRGHAVHVRSCNGGEYSAPARPLCPHCNKPYTVLDAHVARCPQRPGAPAQQKMSRKEARQSAVQISAEQARLGPLPGTFIVPSTEWHNTQTAAKPCPYCKQLHASTPSGKIQPHLCRSCPFTHWLGFSIHKQDKYPPTTEEELKLWTYRCASCGHTWRNMKALAAHRIGCEGRRLASNLAPPPAPL